MYKQTCSMVVAMVVGLIRACAADEDGTDVTQRSASVLDEAELAELLGGADEVIEVGEIEVSHERGATSCGVTISAQELEVIEDDDAQRVSVSVSCAHQGCAGNPQGCQPSGCQPYWNKTQASYFCTAPVCSGANCAPTGCTMTTTLTD